MVNAINEEIKLLYKIEYADNGKNITKAFSEISNFKWTSSNYDQIRKKTYYLIRQYRVSGAKECNLSNIYKLLHTVEYFNGSREDPFSILCKYLKNISGKMNLNRDYYE